MKISDPRIQKALQNNPKKIMELIPSINLNSQENDSGYTLLMYVVRNNWVEVVKALIERKANLDLQDKYGETALMKAIFDSSYGTLNQAQSSADIAIALILQGANLNLQDREGYTALMHAASSGDMPLVKKLREYGGELNIDLYKKLLSNYRIKDKPVMKKVLADIAIKQIEKMLQSKEYPDLEIISKGRDILLELSPKYPNSQKLKATVREIDKLIIDYLGIFLQKAQLPIYLEEQTLLGSQVGKLKQVPIEKIWSEEYNKFVTRYKLEEDATEKNFTSRQGDIREYIIPSREVLTEDILNHIFNYLSSQEIININQAKYLDQSIKIPESNEVTDISSLGNDQEQI